tara:strand:- start:70 stop:264 length:195 start_codon:yes stop_codon:yes gene_type:complete
MMCIALYVPVVEEGSSSSAPTVSELLRRRVCGVVDVVSRDGVACRALAEPLAWLRWPSLYTWPV